MKTPTLNIATNPSTTRRAILVDLDGTLCDLNGRDPYDASNCEDDLPHYEVIDWLDNAPCTVLLLTGRNARFRPQTVEWLTEHEVPYHRLYMRPDGDSTPAPDFKEKLYEEQIAPNYQIVAVVEDDSRCLEMWRQKELPTLPVRNGEFI